MGEVQNLLSAARKAEGVQRGVDGGFEDCEAVTGDGEGREMSLRCTGIEKSHSHGHSQTHEAPLSERPLFHAVPEPLCQAVRLTLEFSSH